MATRKKWTIKVNTPYFFWPMRILIRPYLKILFMSQVKDIEPEVIVGLQLKKATGFAKVVVNLSTTSA
jgi:hypothetical protein